MVFEKKKYPMPAVLHTKIIFRFITLFIKYWNHAVVNYHDGLFPGFLCLELFQLPATFLKTSIDVETMNVCFWRLWKLKIIDNNKINNKLIVPCLCQKHYHVAPWSQMNCSKYYPSYLSFKY